MVKWRLKPAALGDDDWIWRWLHVASGRTNVLHRIAAPFDPAGHEPWQAIEAWTMCGRLMGLRVPGMESRLGAPRCRRCCRASGTPEGYGNPYNEQALR